MSDLKKDEAKVYIRKYLSPFMEDHGFKEKRRKDYGVSYKRKATGGFDALELELIEAFPGQVFRCSVIKRIDLIEKLTDVILQQMEPDWRASKESISLAFSHKTIYNPPNSRNLLHMVNEEDVYINTGLIRQFLSNVAFPMLEQYSNIREIDSMVNGKEFWEDDWKKPFSLGGYFFIKRLILAHLCRNPIFRQLVDYYTGFFKASMNGEHAEEYKKSFAAFAYALDYLQKVPPR